MNKRYRQLLAVLTPLYEAGEARAVAFAVLERFGWSRTDVYLDKSTDLSATEQAEFDRILFCLSEGAPVQYALGTAEFCGNAFCVTPATLIPRPETEELVALALDTAATDVLDVGTGSGCIALTYALRRPAARVEAWDISEAALAVARRNAGRLQATNVFFRHCDVLRACRTPQERRFDLIVSNPPYVCESERPSMARHVVAHEPATALFVPDADPLVFYRALAQLGRTALRPQGRLAVEINSALGHDTAQLFAEAGYRADLRTDGFGRDRFVTAQLIS